MNPPRGHLAALAACVALFLATGCGSSDDEPEGEPIPADIAAAIEKRLDEVQRRYNDGVEDGNAGACQDIEDDSYTAIDASVDGLPQDVDPDVREALEASLARLKELTSEGCADVKEEPVETETQPPQQPVTPPPVPEQPPPEQTETQPTTPEEKPKDEENGKGKGNDGNNGQGNGNGSGGTPPGDDPGAGGGGQVVPPPAGEG